VASSGESNRAAAAEIKLGKAVHLGGFIVVIAVMEKGRSQWKRITSWPDTDQTGQARRGEAHDDFAAAHQLASERIAKNVGSHFVFAKTSTSPKLSGVPASDTMRT
jgi:hypothetical protein